MKLLFLLCAVTSHFLLGICQSTQDAISDCSEPTNVTEMYRKLRASYIDTASAAMNDEFDTGNEQQAVSVTTLNHTCHHPRQERLCHCPTRDELNFDPNRIPKILVQTSCCSENQDNISQWKIKCREVYHDVRVLRKGLCVDGVYSYSMQWERVPIGCSCRVMPNVFSAQ